jgi:hypothetical protein
MRMLRRSTLVDKPLDAQMLIEVLGRVTEGDFNARMAVQWTGHAGKVADQLNDRQR